MVVWVAGKNCDPVNTCHSVAFRDYSGRKNALYKYLILYFTFADALISLHWLRVPERINYKLAVMAYKVLHGRAPSYLGPLVRVADVSGRWHESHLGAASHVHHRRQSSLLGRCPTNLEFSIQRRYLR